MLHQTAIPFGDMQKAIALALHEAGQTDREIADAVSTSVNDIRWWRNGLGLLENLSSEAKARAEEERYTPPLSRSASPERPRGIDRRSEEHTSELQSLMRISYAVFCLKKKKKQKKRTRN